MLVAHIYSIVPTATSCCCSSAVRQPISHRVWLKSFKVCLLTCGVHARSLVATAALNGRYILGAYEDGQAKFNITTKGDIFQVRHGVYQSGIDCDNMGGVEVVSAFVITCICNMHVVLISLWLMTSPNQLQSTPNAHQLRII